VLALDARCSTGPDPWDLDQGQWLQEMDGLLQPPLAVGCLLPQRPRPCLDWQHGPVLDLDTLGVAIVSPSARLCLLSCPSSWVLPARD
jgi:hypothetical protein